VRALNLSFGPVTVHGDPILDALFWQLVPSHEVVINMVEALGPSIDSPLLQLNQTVTETAPKARLAVATNSTVVKLGLDGVWIKHHLMRFYKMLLESLSAITHLGACAAFKSLFVASPSLEVKVLRIFMTLPIILAAKGLVAGQEGAAIWPLVTLHVFPEQLALHIKDVENTYFNSQGRPVNLLQVWQVTWFSLLLLAADPRLWGFGEWVVSFCTI
jgi:hypothetical protein